MRIFIRVKKEPIRRFCRALSILCLVAGAALGLFELLSALGDQPLPRAEIPRPAVLATALVFLTGLLVSRASHWTSLRQNVEEPKIDLDDVIHRMEWFDEHRRRFRR
jgi:hypothetical protein